MNTYGKIVLALVAVCATKAVAHEPEDIDELSMPIVQVLAEVSGETKKGTGFFVDEWGHILTAGHNVLPEQSDLGGSALPSKKVKINRFVKVDGVTSVREIPAVVVYADAQLDVALLRAKIERKSEYLRLSPPDRLRDGLETIIMTWKADENFGAGRPVHRHIHVDSVFNPSKHYNGLVDISGTDLGASSSGGPMHDEFGFALGIFTKGREDAGEAVVPIIYTTSLLRMANVSYPSEDVRMIIEELQRDLLNWTVEYSDEDGVAEFNFEKRLEAGMSPTTYKASFRLFDRKNTQLFIHEDQVSQNPLKGKKGAVRFGGIKTEIQNRISTHNAAARTANPPIEKWDFPSYAIVTITVEFVDGKTMISADDLRMDF